MGTIDEEERKRQEMAQRREAYQRAKENREALGISDGEKSANGLAAKPVQEAPQRKNPYAQQTQQQLTGYGALVSSTRPSKNDVVAAGRAASGGQDGGDDFSIGASAKMYTRNTYDLEKLTHDDVVGIATRIKDDDQRDAFITAYRKVATNKKSANYQTEVPTLAEFREKINAGTPFGVYEGNKRAKASTKASQDAMKRSVTTNSSMQALSSLYDANGNAINANTADLSLMVQGIRSIADSGKRAKAADALETLTKTQGSRFYGQTIDKTLAKTYLSSPDFDEKDYKDFVSGLDGAFWPQSGHEAENRETYQGFLEDIQNSGYDERIARQLRAALDEAYQNATGAAYAGDEPVEQTQTEQTPGEAAAQEQPAGEEKKTGLLERFFGALTETAQPFGFRGDSDKAAEDGAQEQANPGFLDTLANAMQGKLVDDSYFEQRKGGENEQAPEEAAEDAQETGPLGYTKTGTVASATASDVLPPLPGYAPKEKAEAQGPQQRTYRTVESDADVVAAYLGGWYDEIAPQDRETFERWMNSTSAKAVLGVVSDEREINLALSDNGAPELTLMEGTGIGALGMTAYAAREMILGEDFPQELRSYGLTMLTMLGARADQYAQEGTLGGDEGLPNLERLLQTDEESREQLDAIYAARDELTKNMQDARREHEEASAKSLADARAAVLSGQYSDEQLLLVQENAPEAGWKEITADETRAQMAAQVEFIDEGYFAPGGGFEQSAVRAGLDASGVVSDDNYRLALSDKMTVILNEDTQTALSLGLSLDEYYSRVGGMDMDTLCQLAATRMSREGEGMTQEDAQAQSYGSGMGGAVIAAYGITRGVKYCYGTYADSLYMNLTEADVARNAAKMAMQYQQDYGLLAGTQYKKDLQALIDSGDLTEEYGQMVSTLMEEVDNIFAIGIDPGAHSTLRSVGKEARNTIRAMDAQVATYGTESENKWYYRVSSMTSNAIQATVASVGTKLTKSSHIGFFLGYDVMGYGERMNARLAEGYKRGSASYLAAIDTAGSHLANVETFDGIYGRMTGTGSLHTAAAADLLAGNPVGAAKGLSAIKRYVWAGIKSFVASEFDEAFTDEMREGLSKEVVNKVIAPLFRKRDAREQIGASDWITSMLSISTVDVMGVAGDVIRGAKEVFITNSLFALAGAAGDVSSEYKSVQMAKDVVSGKSGDVGAVIDAFNEDAKDPAFLRELDEAAAKAQRDERTAEIIATDDGSDGLLGKQQAAQEQADSHMAHAENSRAAMDEARAVIEEKQPLIDRGEADDTDVQMVNDAQESYAKNKNNDEEATREAAQKQQEADEAAQERLAKARAQAAKEQREAAAKLREKLQSDADAARSAREQQIADAQRRLDEAQDAFERAGENDADLDELDRLSYEMGLRQQELDKMTERSDEEEAALQAAYDKASAELERQQAEEDAAWADYQKAEKLREERERLSGVKRELRTKRILVDDAQAAEIKNMTGARSLSAANRMLGTRFTRSRGNSDVTLDGGYYQELAAMSGGSLDPDSLHPETDIVNLIGTMRSAGLSAGQQASLGETDVLPSVSEDASYGTQDPVTQELASLLYKKTGIELVVAKLADGVRAIYDRQNGRVLVSTRVGSGEQMRMAVLHELTHFTETGSGYDAYRDSILAAAYDGDTDAMQKDMDDLVSKYEEYGIDLTAEDAQRELVAKATERVIGDKDGTLTQQLLDEGYRGTVARIYSKLTSFLARRKAKRAGEAALRQYNMLEDAKKRLREALEARGKWQKGQESGVDPTVEIDAAKRARGEVETDSEQTQMQAVMDAGQEDSGKQYAVGDVGFRMFGNETAQRLDTLTQTVKDALKGTTYEKDTNAEQVDRAQKIIDRDGLSETIDSLLTRSQEEWSADEHALGALCMVLANQPGRVDPIRAMAIAQVYNEAGTKAGKALQVRQIVGKLTPSGAMLGSIENAKAANEKKGIGGNAIPMGNEAPKGKNRKRAGKSGTTVAPMEDVQAMRGPEGDAVQGSFAVQKPAQIVEDIYDKADRTYADLSTLPQNVSRDNPWGIPLNPAQMALIRQFGLMGEKLPGANYSRASLNQRMLAAIISTPNNVRGDGLLTLCQQLHAMKQGLAVVTEADLSYIAGQASEVMAQGVTEAGTPATVEGKIAMARMYDTQANTVPATFGQKFTAIRYANMLSAPATWVRNVASNVLVAPLEKASTWIASAWDAAVAKRTGTRTTAYTTKEERAAGRDAAVQEVVNTVRDYFVTHTDTSHGRKYDTGKRGRTFQNAWLDAYDNIVGFAMQIGDRPFYEACYAEELAVIKRLGMKVRDTDAEGNAIMRDMTAEEMHGEATMRALERVFQEDSAVVNWLNSAPEEVSFFLKTIVPFAKTPTNIARRMLQYSPVGLTKALLWDGLVKGKRNNGNDFDQRKFVMGVGRGLTGTGMIAAGAILGAMGVLHFGRGDEEDARLRAMRTALGEPYGMYLKIGDKDYEIDWALPSAAPLIMGASMAQRMQDGETGMTLGLGMLADMGDELFNNSFLSALNDVFRGYEDTTGLATRFAQTMTENLLNQTLSPSFIRAMAKATDPYVRDTTDDSLVWSVLKQNVIQYWPGLRQTLPIKTDITGDKALQSGYYNWGKEHQNAALHFLNTFLTPTMPIGEKNDAAILELVDLSYRTGETGFLPGYLVTSSGKLNLDKDSAKKLGLGDGKHVYPLSLNAEETRRANELYGNILFNGTQGVKYPKAGFGTYAGDEVKGLRALMESREWARATDEERMEKVKKMQSAVKEIVAVQIARGQME